MGQSFYTSIGGIKAAQSGLNIVSDNLANLNTIAFKQSTINFSDVYYSTLSAGSAATSGSGGTNPTQIGLGTQVSSITKDFTTGSTQTTGNGTDMMITGNGFFTVTDSTGNIKYTRAGNFTLDGSGNLVMPNGNKVLGTNDTFSTKPSTTAIKIPPLIQTTTSANDAVTINAKTIADINGAEIAEGDFTINITNAGTTTPTTVSVASTDNIASVITQIQTKLDEVAAGAFTVSLADGKLTITPTGTGTLSFAIGTSDFPKATGLTNSAATGPYTSDVLDWQQTVTASTDSSSAQKYKNMEVSATGVIEVTYDNGDKITVTQDKNGDSVFKYTTKDGIEITGADCKVDTSFLTPANLQMQLANFINPNGLVAEGGNCYSEGTNCGEAFYGTASDNGFGSIQGGATEASNVDMTEQFANMIIAQRAIEANSRVFSAQNEIMQTLVGLGR